MATEESPAADSSESPAPGDRLAAGWGDPRRLSLELLKQVLTRVVAPDETVRARMPEGVEPTEAEAVEKFLDRHGLVLARHRPFDVGARSIGRDWPFRGETMIGLARLDNLERCIVDVLEDGVPGDFVETGVWRGGATIFMRAALAVHGDDERRVWVADSFEGLPPPRPNLYPADEGDQFHTYTPLAVSRERVEANFAKYGLLDDRVCFLEGWFHETLPSAPIEELAIARLDGDMYESTIVALEALYPKLSVGGYLIVDDYGAVPGCRQAVDDYREAQGITEPLEWVDWGGAYWRREA